MANKTRPLAAVLLLAVSASTAYQYIFAEENSAEVRENTAAGAHLVVIDLGTDGVEQTVLLDPFVIKLGSHEFLRGDVSDAYREFGVVYPGNVASIRMERVVYIQRLPRRSSPNAG